MTFSDLRRKEVVNVCDGKKLGCVSDMVLSPDGCRIDAIVVPGSFSLLSCFFKKNNIIIPWNKIRKLGEDVILADAGELSLK